MKRVRMKEILLSGGKYLEPAPFVSSVDFIFPEIDGI